MRFIKRFIRGTGAQDLIEYALLGSLVSLTLALVINVLGQGVLDRLESYNVALSSSDGGSGGSGGGGGTGGGGTGGGGTGGGGTGGGGNGGGDTGGGGNGNGNGKGGGKK
jgi:Flp pilus assembly pilin Flp